MCFDHWQTTHYFSQQPFYTFRFSLDHYVQCQWQSVLIYIYSYVVSVWVYFTFMMCVSVSTEMPII